MSVAFKKLDGVESVKVTLNEGKAVIQLKPGNSVRMEHIRKTVTDQGFTPKEARVVAVGDLTVSDGRMLFKVTGSNDVFPVGQTAHGVWRERVGQDLVITGVVTAPRSKEEFTIQLLQVSKEPPAEKEK